MKLDGADVPPCHACEDNGPCPGHYWCKECDGEGYVNVLVRGYGARAEKCDTCFGLKSFVCAVCEGTGDEPEDNEEESRGTANP